MVWASAVIKPTHAVLSVVTTSGYVVLGGAPLFFIIARFLLLLYVGFWASLVLAGEAGTVVFAVGSAHIGQSSIAVGDGVNEGDEIRTGGDGYLYLKTIDNGFLVLRPNSRARIVVFHVDREHPQNTRIKFELLSGVARSISGEAARQSRESFRFNTPVAAIGIRGTDFTVFTDQETSRVSVAAGGVVVSGFTEACTSAGAGPCQGVTTRELFERNSNLMIQVTRAQVVPSLIKINELAPDLISSPRSDEPTSKTTSKINGLSVPNDTAAVIYPNNSLVNTVDAAVVTAVAATTAPQTDIIWGRWQVLLNQSPTIDLTTQLNNNGARLVAINSNFALLTDKNRVWITPSNISLGFALQQSEAYVLNTASNAVNNAALQNGVLQVNFSTSTFNTSFNVLYGSSVAKLQALGSVTPTGELIGANQFIAPTNMVVNGVLSNQNGGSAAYLFQSRIDSLHSVTGATYWTAK